MKSYEVSVNLTFIINETYGIEAEDERAAMNEAYVKARNSCLGAYAFNYKRSRPDEVSISYVECLEEEE